LDYWRKSASPEPEKPNIKNQAGPDEADQFSMLKRLELPYACMVN